MEVIELQERLIPLIREHISTFEEVYGYPPGENVIKAAPSRENAAVNVFRCRIQDPAFSPRALARLDRARAGLP